MTRMLLCLTFAATALAAFDPSALIPDLEELASASLTQVIASVSNGASSSLELQEQYRQIQLAEHAFLNMLEEITADQANDDRTTATIQMSISADITTLQIELQQQRKSHAHQLDVLEHLNVALASSRASFDLINATLAQSRDVLTDTRSECKSLSERRSARTESLHTDIALVARVVELADSFDCGDVQDLIQSFSTRLSPQESREVGCDCTNLIQTTASGIRSVHQTGCDCESTAGSVGTLTPKELRFSCETRKQHVMHLLEDLKMELYSSVSQDALSFGESVQACQDDVLLQEETRALLAKKIDAVAADIEAMQTDATAVAEEIRLSETTITSMENALELANSRLATADCRHKKRASMREEQRKTLAALLTLMADLSKSGYSDRYGELSVGCKANCSGHGSCFRGECHCDFGWITDDCSVSTSRYCPFEKNSAPCTSSACYSSDFSTLSESSPCATVVCDHCRADPLRPGCGVPSVALFCAEKDKAVGCDAFHCPVESANATCGLRRSRKTEIAGCCFNPLLDCADICVGVTCQNTEPTCGYGLSVRYPYRSCCFDPAVDCVDACDLASCSAQAPSCPAGKVVRHPFSGCCFDAAVDCEDDCASIVCDESILPGDACRAQGLRWSGGILGCCFNARDDCLSGDDAGQAGERMALQLLYSSTKGKNWKNAASTLWNTESWICYWEGVQCSGKSGDMHVTSLGLAATGLQGTLPPEIEQLNKLKFVDLSENALEGPIPDEISFLTNLQTLRLKQNQLTGTLPKGLTALSKLEILDISRNLISGSLPEGFGAGMTLCSQTCLCDVECTPRMTPASPFNVNSVACPACEA